MTRLERSVYHHPVMATECLDYLAIRRDGRYVDATLGGGGHTALILAHLGPEGRLTSFDADDVAITHCRERFADELANGDQARLRLVHANFASMSSVLSQQPLVNGILFDLGVSSFQFDHHGRGFSYRFMAPLDMRFLPEGTTAADLLNDLDEDEIAAIIRDYGEDPSARRLARAIVQRRRLAPLRTTADLRDVVVQTIPPHHQARTLARTFQALRIAVNDELGVLERTLAEAVPHLAPGGRIVVMSYHSLEDRIVKDTFRRLSARHGDVPPPLSLLTKKPVEATEDEITANPRARSAKLRVAERIFATDSPSATS